MKLRAVVLVAVFWFIPNSSAAQQHWVPVVSRIRATYDVLESGDKKTVEVKEGFFYRNSNGSTLIQWTSVNGDASRGGKMELFDNTTGADYMANSNARTLQQLQSPKKPQTLSPDFLSRASENNLGQEIIEGLTCFKVSTTYISPDGTMVPAGGGCQSAEYGLTLKLEILATEPGGNKTHRTLTEMYSIEVGKEPDPKLFDFSNFQILTSQNQPPPKP